MMIDVHTTNRNVRFGFIMVYRKPVSSWIKGFASTKQRNMRKAWYEWIPKKSCFWKWYLWTIWTLWGIYVLFSGCKSSLVPAYSYSKLGKHPNSDAFFFCEASTVPLVGFFPQEKTPKWLKKGEWNVNEAHQDHQACYDEINIAITSSACETPKHTIISTTVLGDGDPTCKKGRIAIMNKICNVLTTTNSCVQSSATLQKTGIKHGLPTRTLVELLIQNQHSETKRKWPQDDRWWMYECYLLCVPIVRIVFHPISTSDKTYIQPPKVHQRLSGRGRTFGLGGQKIRSVDVLPKETSPVHKPASGVCKLIFKIKQT